MHTFHGPHIRGCLVTKIVDGRTLKVKLNPSGGQVRSATRDGWDDATVSEKFPVPMPVEQELDADSTAEWEEVTVRLVFVDAEEANEQKKELAPYKPVTAAGIDAASWFKKRLGAANDGRCGDVPVDIEFDVSMKNEGSIERAREVSVDAYGRLLAYVWKDGTNINVDALMSGNSAYFTKHGRSRLYHGEMALAEKLACEEMRGIWCPTQDFAWFSEYKRNYGQLLPWWHQREMFIEDFRHWQHLGLADDVLNPQHDYKKLMAAAAARETATILVDFQPTNFSLYDGIMSFVRYKTNTPQPITGVCIFAGTKKQPFNLWIDTDDSAESERIQSLIHHRYSGLSQNYALVTGKLFIYHAKQRPQMTLESCDQISDFPCKPEDMSAALRVHARTRACAKSQSTTAFAAA